MIEIIDGDVVVVRDGEFVEAVYYRQFYDDISQLVDQVIEYLNDKKFKEPNLSFMKFVDTRLVPIEKGCEFFDEFVQFARIFNFENCVCDVCGHLQFIFLDTTKTFCPTCKTHKIK
ncbi:MAG: hypothetical protein RRZ69_03555 [Clostridia bacterium]